MNRTAIRKIQVGTPVKTPYGWSIPSLSTGELYEIEVNRWGRWTCTCPSPERPCKHVRKVMEVITAEADETHIAT